VAIVLLAAGCSANPTSHQTKGTEGTGPKSSTTTTACTLHRTTKYIERMSEPGLAPSATEIWNANLTNCTSTLSDFPQTVGIGPGECTQIALASANPGYDVLGHPAVPLKDVITQAGPGCSGP
jgi:hypothetical protein